MNIKELVDRIIKDGKITKATYEDFLSKVNEGGKINADENDQIKRLFDMIQKGKLKVE